MKKLLRSIKRLVDWAFGTVADELFWRFRHIIDHDWAKSYVSDISLRHPHRGFLIEILASYAPFSSALEIGCASGANLYLLSQRFPSARLYGVDISKQAIAVGREWSREQHIHNIEFTHAKAHDLQTFPDKSIDIVFTNAALIYVGPDKIEKVLKEMTRIAKKAIVLSEWYSDRPSAYIEEHWAYNYEVILRKASRKPLKIKITRIPKGMWAGGWGKYGYIIEVE